MTGPMPWFDREFFFDYPVTMFAALVERLRGTPARLEELIGRLSGETLVRRDGDCWSILENAGHLLDLEPLWYGRVEDFLTGERTLRPADLENRKTHEANHNDTAPQKLLASFRQARQQLVALLDGMDERAAGRSALHPRLKQQMRVVDLAFFIAEHDDHHLTRITALTRAS